MGNVSSHTYTYAGKRSFACNCEENNGQCGLAPPNNRFERTHGTSPFAAQPNVRWTPSAPEERMKEYKLIFIDADDTLFDYKAAEKNALTKSLNQYDIDCDHKIIIDYSQINKQLWVDYENNKITQEDLRTERFKRLFAKMNKDINANDFSDVYLRYLAESSFLFNDAAEICSYLHDKYKLALITNGISVVQRNRLRNSKIEKYIDYLIISEEAKYSKPNAGIFSYAETITNYKDKENMIIIGDSLS